MKTSVKFLFVITLVLSSIYTQAQSSFGIKGGINFATVTISGGSGAGSFTPESKTGFNVGLISEIPLATNFYLQPGLLFTTKGFSTEGVTLSTNNIEIPINALCKLNLGSVKVLGFAGPYISYSLSGKVGTDKIEFSGDDKMMNAFDLGLNVGAGLEISKFQITAQYGLGLTNIVVGTGDGSVKNKVLGVSVAYLF